MNDKELLQEIVYMLNDYVNCNTGYYKSDEFIRDLTRFIEQNVIHCAMDNNYK